MTSSSEAQPQVPPAWRKQDWAYEQLREWVIVGRLPAGERVDQEQLARALGVSRVPVREALARLTSEGLFHGRAHQQLTVTEMTIADARDVYTGRAALETELARSAALHASPAQVARLTAILDAQHELIGSGSPDEFRQVDREFHRTIHESAGTPRTAGAADALFAMSQRYVRLYLSDRARSIRSFEDHTRILDAIRSHDADGAATLADDHVRLGLGSLEQMIP